MEEAGAFPTNVIIHADLSALGPNEGQAMTAWTVQIWVSGKYSS